MLEIWAEVVDTFLCIISSKATIWCSGDSLLSTSYGKPENATSREIWVYIYIETDKSAEQSSVIFHLPRSLGTPRVPEKLNKTPKMVYFNHLGVKPHKIY